MPAYYNEHDPKAAAWLRELIREGLIAPGDVDERSIEDVVPAELAGYAQCHFFAGIGGWSYALRLAGWPDDRPVWTGSCPCQPFSAAGKGKGTADERHLWPAFHWLIAQRSPAVVFGEQVASKAGRAWLDTVRVDLEALGYAVGAADLCAAGVGAPHIRQRLWWVANAHGRDPGAEGVQRSREHRQQQENGSLGLLANRSSSGLEVRGVESPWGEREAAERGGEAGGVANPEAPERRRADDERNDRGRAPEAGRSGSGDWSCPPDSLWSAPDWLFCRDGKWRPVESGSFPLAHGVPARVGRLRGYGNAIVPQVAQAFIEAAASLFPLTPTSCVVLSNSVG